MTGPRAPKDPTKKRKGFFIMRSKSVAGSIQPDGRGVQFLYMDGGRMINASRMIGNIEDESILKMLESVEGFRKLVHSIGVTVESDNKDQMVTFAFQMYGHKDVYGSGTTLKMDVPADGFEYILNLDECEWSDDDNVPGQIRFEFAKANELATVAVRFYVQDGFDVPEPEEEFPVDLNSPYYKEMIGKSLLNTGNNARLKKAIDKARAGEDVTVAFIGGSITQGAGAIPINKQCYAYKTFEGFCKMVGKGTEENIHYVKAGVGGTPSELGMLRYDRDVCKDGEITPDIVVVEFAVNDEGDETKGQCYDALVRKIYSAENHPAVILLFAVFANDWNLQDRLSPVGYAYELPMVSTRDTVVEQFYKKPGEGKVVSKTQFFYDSFHPTNTGHTIMADGILHLMHTVDAMEAMEDTVDVSKIEAPFDAEFEKVKLLDRKQNLIGAVIDPGSFCHQDGQTQFVERDLNLFGTPEFAENWMQQGKSGVTYKPFSMDITCTALILIYKDSADNQVGSVDVFVDGEKVLSVDPHEIGWNHCNPYICFRKKERKSYHVEVKMQPGQEDKDFTILGFGYVE